MILVSCLFKCYIPRIVEVFLSKIYPASKSVLHDEHGHYTLPRLSGKLRQLEKKSHPVHWIQHQELFLVPPPKPYKPEVLTSSQHEG